MGQNVYKNENETDIIFLLTRHTIIVVILMFSIHRHLG